MRPEYLPFLPEAIMLVALLLVMLLRKTDKEKRLFLYRFLQQGTWCTLSDLHRFGLDSDEVAQTVRTLKKFELLEVVPMMHFQSDFLIGIGLSVCSKEREPEFESGKLFSVFPERYTFRLKEFELSRDLSSVVLYPKLMTAVSN